MDERPVIGFGVQRKGDFTFVKEDTFPFLYGDSAKLSGEVKLLVGCLLSLICVFCRFF